MTDIRPRTDSLDDLAAAERLDAASNRVFLDPVYLGDYVDRSIPAARAGDQLLVRARNVRNQ